MQNQLFIRLAADANDPDVINVQTGKVVGTVGVDKLLLKFYGKDHSINHVVSIDKLDDFAFFDSPKDQAAYLALRFPPPKPVQFPPEAPSSKELAELETGAPS